MRLTLIALLLAGVAGCGSEPAEEKAAQSQPEYKKIRLAGDPQSYMVEQYRELAEQGHAYAQCSLGDRYLNGAEVPEDHVEAYAWYSVAATNGDEVAKEGLPLVKAELTREQLTAAQRRAAELYKQINANKAK